MAAVEAMFSAMGSVTAYFARLGPAEAALNIALTAGVTLLALAADYAVRRLLRYGAKQLPGQSTAEKMVRVSRVTRFTWVMASIAIVATAFFFIAGIWHINLALALKAIAGAQAVRTAAGLAILTVIAYAAFEFTGFAIGQTMGRLVKRSTANRRRAAQLRTIDPLLRGIAQGTILVLLILMGLSELGVQIMPLLAGAGIVGIAIGFGAQTLVKDFLTGMFLIIEDIVSVGDVVRIGDSSGLVEAMSLRTIRLRDFDGTLHVFPYGEAQVVHNLTKTFSYYVFNLQISYDSDIDRALSVMHKVGKDMQADHEFGQYILEPIDVVGVDDLADSGVALKARVKTLPTEQWKVGREYNRRIKLAFDREGIEIPFPHMKIVLPERQLTEFAGR